MYKNAVNPPNIRHFFVLLQLKGVFMQIEPIAYFESPFTSKFGIPRQSGLAETVGGRIVFVEPYRQAEALRGLESFDYVWIVWGFSANVAAPKHPTVRPPRLGGNERLGVWATRSPFRPNNLGLSSVRIRRIVTEGAGAPSIEVMGADLMDGTPIYDVKPYLPYADSHPDARGGFTDTHQWEPLHVVLPADVARLLTADERAALSETLSLDPRPSYQSQPDRIYGMPFGRWDIRFRVAGRELTVVEVVKK